jgi:aspartate-semialdehyde dehydrogenase
MKVAVVGATGMVGNVMLKVLEERNFPITELYPVASKKSVGKNIYFKGKPYEVIGLADAVKQKPDIALFSAGGQTSLDWAPKFAAQGTTVIDNSSAWRMHEDIKLVVPEINADQITEKDKIIANPNCSTIQLVMALKPLHDAYGIKRVIVSTYQSITGTGVKAVLQLENEYLSKAGEQAYPYPIHKNALPHCDVFLENDYTKEEMKLTNETKKILSDDSVTVVATAVRIPVVGGHSESVNIEFEKAFDIDELKQKLKNFSGVIIQDNPSMNTYPMPLYAEGKNEVFIGRIRRDFSVENGVNMWIVADNLRKGAATNAVQIAEYIVEKFKS